jgi:hypothetical protein
MKGVALIKSVFVLIRNIYPFSRHCSRFYGYGILKHHTLAVVWQ